jgi:hypothetical protein
MQFDFPGLIFGDDAGIFDINEVFVLEPLQCCSHLRSTVLVRIDDRNKICHGYLLLVVQQPVKRSTRPLNSKRIANGNVSANVPSSRQELTSLPSIPQKLHDRAPESLPQSTRRALSLGTRKITGFVGDGCEMISPCRCLAIAPTPLAICTVPPAGLATGDC